MKIYEWTFKGRKGTVTASNTKEAKTMLATQLRGPNDKSSRVPKGTKIKKIGLSKSNKVDFTDSAGSGLVAVKVESKMEAPKPVEKQVRCTQVSEVKFEKLAKDTKFSNCVIQFEKGGMCYASENCELIVSKGVSVCKTVSW
jgi:hypothetical protein